MGCSCAACLPVAVVASSLLTRPNYPPPLQHDAREVSWQEGADFAKQHGCLFVETSAKQNIAVAVAFEELVLRILDTPSLLEGAEEEEQPPGGTAINLAQPAQAGGQYAVSCSC